MTWATFESALDGARDASVVLDALRVSSMAEVQETLGGIGAGEAGPLLAHLQAAGSLERRSKLAASLDIIDRYLVIDAPVAKRRGRFGPTHLWTGQATRYGDMARAALLAGLIDSELGGDAEGQRRRFALALTAVEGHLAAERDRLTTDDFNTEDTEGRRVCLGVSRLVLTGLKSRRAGWRGRQRS